MKSQACQVEKFSLMLNFSQKSHAYQVEEYNSISNYWDYERAIFGPYKGHVLAISTISLVVDASNGSNFH